eukprot:2076107-Alexandrium_andersonii.AAC.1
MELPDAIQDRSEWKAGSPQLKVGPSVSSGWGRQHRDAKRPREVLLQIGRPTEAVLQAERAARALRAAGGGAPPHPPR